MKSIALTGLLLFSQSVFSMSATPYVTCDLTWMGRKNPPTITQLGSPWGTQILTESKIQSERQTPARVFETGWIFEFTSEKSDKGIIVANVVAKNLGASVGKGDPIITIQSTTTYSFQVPVDDKDRTIDLSNGNKLTLRLALVDATGKKIKAEHQP